MVDNQIQKKEGGTSSELERWVKRYLTSLVVERGASELTKRNYEFYLTRFLAYSKLTKPSDITLDDVRDFRLYLNQQLNNRGERLTKSTQNYHLIALRSFLKYLAKNDVTTLAPEKIELAKTSERQVNFIEGDDLERLLEAPLKTKEPEIIKLRDKAILELLFSTGLRVSELSRLSRDELNLNKDEFTVRGKGGKYRVVFLSNHARHFIGEYLNARRDDHKALFIRHDHAAARSSEINELIPLEATKNKVRTQYSSHSISQRGLLTGLTPRSIQRLVAMYAKLAGVNKRITPHTLRHSYATDLLINGADIRSVQAMLGHASITTTQIYTHVTNQQLRDVYKAFHGRRRRSK
ncbi:MAG: tyrosine-type recombinase/integrase [Candidatus Kerfeldbacteria bacterium]